MRYRDVNTAKLRSGVNKSHLLLAGAALAFIVLAALASRSSSPAAARPLAEVCSRPRRFLKRGQKPKRLIALASFPGSGNTWTRHLVETATRIHTGSVYGDKSVSDKFPGESRSDSSVVAVKTHFPCGGCWQMAIENTYKNRDVRDSETLPVKGATAVIYVVRSPFDSIWAEFNRITTDDHTGVLSQTELDMPMMRAKFNRFVDSHSKMWFHHADFYLKHDLRESSKSVGGLNDVRWTTASGAPVFVLFFENLKKDAPLEMERLVEWLSPVFTKSDALPTPQQAGSCVAHDDKGSFKRSTKNRFNPYTDAQKKQLCLLVERVWHENEWGPCDGRLQWERS